MEVELFEKCPGVCPGVCPGECPTRKEITLKNKSLKNKDYKKKTTLLGSLQFIFFFHFFF